MSSKKVSPIARARATAAKPAPEAPKPVSQKAPATPAPASSSGKVSPIARAREGAAKGERRKSAEKAGQKVSPIARARESKAATKKSPEVLNKNLDLVEEDDEEFPPLSVPFGLECYLKADEIEKATAYIKKSFPNTRKKVSEHMTKFQIYTVDYNEREAASDPEKEYESVLVFHWFRPAVGVNILDIQQVWEAKKSLWHGLLWTANLMPEGKIDEDIQYPEMLDPVEEEDEE